MSPKNTKPNSNQGLGDLVERRRVADSAPVALVIDDDPESRKLAAAMLAHLGFAARAAGTPDDAMHILMDETPAIMLVDLCLPMMDGISLIRLVRGMRDLKGVPMVALSGVYPNDGPVRRALGEQGIYAFLSKPFTVAELREASDFSRSAALRQGSPPPCTMKPGGIWDAEEAEERAERLAREAAGRERGAPRALPASPEFSSARRREQSQRRGASTAAAGLTGARTRPAQLPGATPPSPPAPTAAPKQKKPPAMGPASSTQPASATGHQSTLCTDPTDNGLYDLELDGVVQVGQDSGPATLLFIESSKLRIRSPKLPLDEGASARLQLRYRVQKEDSFEPRTLRVLGQLSRVSGEGNAWEADLKVSAAQPVEALYDLCALFDERQS